jgi:ElaB/YqjD/DUF883 family membrane-anchored ribosome-binding protein
MAETADQIRARIEATRADLDRKLNRLEGKARRELSLKARVAQRPWQFVGVAAGAGLMLGLVFGSAD